MKSYLSWAMCLVCWLLASRSHIQPSLCARVSLFEGDVQVSVCRSLKLLRAVVARGCSEFARLSVGRGAAVRLCHATSTFRMHIVVCSLFCTPVVECNLCSKHMCDLSSTSLTKP